MGEDGETEFLPPTPALPELSQPLGRTWRALCPSFAFRGLLPGRGRPGWPHKTEPQMETAQQAIESRGLGVRWLNLDLQWCYDQIP